MASVRLRPEDLRRAIAGDAPSLHYTAIVVRRT